MKMDHDITSIWETPCDYGENYHDSVVNWSDVVNKKFPVYMYYVLAYVYTVVALILSKNNNLA